MAIPPLGGTPAYRWPWLKQGAANGELINDASPGTNLIGNSFYAYYMPSTGLVSGFTFNFTDIWGGGGGRGSTTGYPYYFSICVYRPTTTFSSRATPAFAGNYASATPVRRSGVTPYTQVASGAIHPLNPGNGTDLFPYTAGYYNLSEEEKIKVVSGDYLFAFYFIYPPWCAQGDTTELDAGGRGNPGQWAVNRNISMSVYVNFE